MKFAIALSAYEYETDLNGVVIEEETPLMAIIKAFSQVCKEPVHKVCHILEHESWECICFSLEDPVNPVIVGWRDIGWPWNRRSDINKQIASVDAEAPPTVGREPPGPGGQGN